MKRLLSIIAILFLCGCSSKSFETEQELWDYIKNPEHGYFQKKHINGYDFSLLYKPTDLLVQQELSDEMQGQQRVQKTKELREKYGKYLYFSLSMSSNGKELLSTTPKNRNEFGQMVNQLAFGMGSKVHLFTSKKDTLNLLDYNYPRMYGMGGATTMLFIYPKDQKYLDDEYLNFTIEDLGIYTGEVKFKIGTDILERKIEIKSTIK